MLSDLPEEAVVFHCRQCRERRERGKRVEGGERELTWRDAVNRSMREAFSKVGEEGEGKGGGGSVDRVQRQSSISSHSCGPVFFFIVAKYTHRDFHDCVGCYVMSFSNGTRFLILIDVARL